MTILRTKTSKALNELKKLIPEGSAISSFFLYDGALEMGLAKYNRTVVAHTNKQTVFEFWQGLKLHHRYLASIVEFMFERLTIPELEILQDNWYEYNDHVERAAFFYILNRCSNTGYASHGNLNKEQLKPAHINSLRRFENKNFYPFFDNVKDPIEGIATAKDTEYLLFPVGKFSHNFFDYGKNVGHDMVLIDHKNLKQNLENIDKNWIVIYNFSPYILKSYKDYNIVMIDKYGNKTKNMDRCHEIIINNFVSV